MSTFSLDPAMSAALWITVKASVLLGVAAIVQAVIYRRTSAAMRHMVWTLVIVGVLLLPMLSLALPEWTAVTRTAATNAADAAPVLDSIGEAAAPARPSASHAATAGSAPVGRSAVSAVADKFSWPIVSATVYAAGVLIMLIHLAMQRWSVRRLACEATDVRDRGWMRLLSESAASMGVCGRVRLLRSRERSMPMAFGTRRPAIVIPAVADTWPEDRRRAVVLHELAHVARHDCLTQSLACAACTMYWFHPGAWWVARRLRVERELACDDRVIMAGAQAREYAGHLLEIAYAFGSHRAPALAVSMARPRQLEGRMLAMLDVARKRSVPALRVRVEGAVIAAALLRPLAGATPTVVAVEPDADRTPAMAAPLPAPPQDPAVSAQHLKAVELPLAETARRIVHAAAAAIGIPQDRLPGTWEIRPTGTEGSVHLRLVEVNSSSGSNIPIERLEGLTTGQLAGVGGPVQFRLRRDAGTFTFEGSFGAASAQARFRSRRTRNSPRNSPTAALPGRLHSSNTRWRATMSATHSWTS